METLSSHQQLQQVLREIEATIREHRIERELQTIRREQFQALQPFLEMHN